MVVADEDPPRKRSRLSLKSKKGDNATQSQAADSDTPPSLESTGAVPQGPVSESEQDGIDCSPPVVDLTESDLPCDGPGVPPVASMENLGNTCFLNSVLEVLRYTPCFLEGLEQLYRHIVYLEKVKSADVVQASEEVKTEPSLAWELVKNLFKMYKRMEKREEMFTQFASADVTSMAVKPDKILDAIREFNPMFEGNMQHDAQELLRCLLCYLEDSERELHTDYASILALDPSLLKTPAKNPDPHKQCPNPIMENFLSAGKAKSRRRKAVSALKFEKASPETAAETFNTGSTSKPADSLVGLLSDDSGAQNTETSVSVQRQKRTRFRHTKKVMKAENEDTKSNGMSEENPKSNGILKEDENGDEVDGNRPQMISETCSNPLLSEKEESSTGKTTPRNTRRSRRAAGRGKMEESTAKGDVKSGKQIKVSQMNGDCSGKEKESLDVLREGGKVPKACMNGSLESPPDKSQPTILSMFGTSNGRQCRRLGMRGRVIHKTEITPANPTPSPSSELSPELRRSPRKSNNVRHAAMPVSPRKQPHASPTSPARPDEFPAHVVNGDTNGLYDPASTAVDSLPNGSVTAQYWDTGCLESPKKCFEVKTCNGSLSDMQVSEDEEDQENFGVKSSVFENGNRVGMNGDFAEHNGSVSVKTERSSPRKFKSAKMSPMKSHSASPVKSNCLPASNQAKTEQSSPKKYRSARMSPATSGLNGLPSPAKRENPSQSPSDDPKDTPGSQSSKLMIKLEKCDHLCNSPTISASAAMKAMKGPSTSGTCRKMSFSGGDFEDSAGRDQDSDEDETSLGVKSSFKSVPLKSVSVKVEKCDMVCSSPEKSVSARFATTCLARQRAQRFNIMEKLFQGTMMMRTKCVECERCTERKESFQDVSVPLKAESNADSDSDTDEEKDSCLLRLMHAFTDVERLREDNKYFCEKCTRYVEAERSLHYEALPNILTVHLKRFSATGMFGCLSKINDHVTVPLTLSCLRYKCPKPCVRPDHRYTLFAIITHAGSTISSGHYLSYIKVRPNAVGCDTLSNYLNSPEKKPDSPSSGDEDQSNSAPLLGFDVTDSAENVFSPNGDCVDSQIKRKRFNSVSENQGSVHERGDGKESIFDSPKDDKKSSKSSGSRLSSWPGNGDGVSEKGDARESIFDSPKEHKKGSRNKLNPQSQSCSKDGQFEEDSGDYHWLECDDETIRILSETEFQGRLLEKEGALRGTPYVLFYHRLDTWRSK